VGTTLPSILPSAATGTLQYWRARLIEWRMVAWTAPFGLVAAVAGAALSKIVPGDGHWLMVLTAVLLGITAWRMARPQQHEQDAAEVVKAAGALGATEAEEALAATPHHAGLRDAPPVLAGIGAVAGLLSGLLGVGGGIVMVPAFTEIVRTPVKTSIATSLACVGLFAVPGTITHAAYGDIDWRFALWLAVGVVPGARLGARAAIRTSDRRLRLTVALFLGAVALLYATGELISLAR
jgi:uncharacterized protein